MIRKLFYTGIIFIICLIFLSFYSPYMPDLSGINQPRSIVLQFITYNGYGNNLYIDNVLTGVQQLNDVTVTSITNIPYDTTYSTLVSGIDSVAPRVTVSNIGRAAVTDSIAVYLQIDPGGYMDSVRLPQMNTGQTVTATFKTFNYQVGTGYYFKAYTSYSVDTNRTNDTLNQFSIILPGFTRNVLLEEFTSNASPACANNNHFLDNFVNNNIQSVAAIKYHTGALGIDSFYFANPEQSDARRRYYYINGVPTSLFDGKLLISIPYGDTGNLYVPYRSRLSKGTPLSMTVMDERVKGDSIRTTINVNIISPLPAGNYKLRINAVERLITDSVKASNGETNFYDVFRASYPDTNGISISTLTGSSQYQYTYYKNPSWIDSMIYTTAFIQNDDNREVMNCAKGRNIVVPPYKNIYNIIRGKADLFNAIYQYRNKSEHSLFTDSIQTSLNVELFEAFFPPLGWKIFNQDGNITFSQYAGVNGPTIGGSNSVIMDFYDYNNVGQIDSMYSKFYTNLLSSDTIRFDYSYAQYNSTNIDSLIVKVSTDDGMTFPTEIFRKGGLNLATAPQTTSFFIPTNNTQWRSYKFSLNGIVSASSTENLVPTKFVLNQNYPNPFNPKTIISYEIPVSGNVKLLVYDILGKEIKTLVNEKQTTGNYKIDFDAGNLPSGVYFYRLITDGFTDTKRMVLIK